MSSELINRIDKFFSKKTRLLASLYKEPRLTCVGNYVAPKELSVRIDYWRNKLSEPGYYNEKQAILSGEMTTDINGLLTIPYKVIDFATACTIRETGEAPLVLSVSSIAVCLEMRTLYLHKRSPNSYPAPSKLHGFSGACRTDEIERLSIIDECLREFCEETAIKKYDRNNLSHPVNLVLLQDDDYGALETCLLAIPITIAHTSYFRPTHEGEVFPLHFDNILESLSNTDDIWTEGGKLEVITWLANGALPCCSHESFSGLTPIQLIEKITSVPTLIE